MRANEEMIALIPDARIISVWTGKTRYFPKLQKLESLT